MSGYGRPTQKEKAERFRALHEGDAPFIMANPFDSGSARILAAVGKVYASLTKPFSFMVGVPGRSFPVKDLAAVGVRRISLATSLYRTAMGSVEAAAREVLDLGTFTYVEDAMPSARLADYMWP